MLAPTSPIPSIEISLAPPEDIPVEPYSPFASIAFPAFSDDNDSPRSIHLLPPPASSPRHAATTQRSSLASSAAVTGKGLDRAYFEAMLAATRERNALKKAFDLRKEVALKAHKTKQAERRAVFLSKLEAPPSPSATLIPVTPPETPAVLHYSLPSPGLDSPISLFESLDGPDDLDNDHQRRIWIEQVDFQSADADWDDQLARKEAILAPRRAQPKKALPSLDQIQARMGTQQAPVVQRKPANVLPIGRAVPVQAPTPRAPIPLPAFLRSRTPSQADPTSPAAPARLPLPVLNAHGRSKAPTPPPPPHPKFHPTTTILPGSSPAPSEPDLLPVGTPLTLANLSLLESRNEKGKAMLQKILRRVSSPAELERAGKRRGEVFGEHKVLQLPGGF